MSTIDLILLGSLYQSPKSPYELQKQIEDRNLSRWVKIGKNTVYKNVVIYEKKGYVTSETVKNGKMPDKTLYSITDFGKEYFVKLMTDISNIQTRVFLEFNAVVVNLALLDKNSALNCISNIKKSIANTKMQISEQLPSHNNIPLCGKTILEQQYMILETLEKWEQNFEQQFAKESK